MLSASASEVLICLPQGKPSKHCATMLMIPTDTVIQPYVGIPELRKGFAAWYQRWYGVELNPNTEIQPLIGSKEGILHVTLDIRQFG